MVSKLVILLALLFLAFDSHSQSGEIQMEGAEINVQRTPIEVRSFSELGTRCEEAFQELDKNKVLACFNDCLEDETWDIERKKCIRERINLTGFELNCVPRGIGRIDRHKMITQNIAHKVTKRLDIGPGQGVTLIFSESLPNPMITSPVVPNSDDSHTMVILKRIGHYFDITKKTYVLQCVRARFKEDIHRIVTCYGQSVSSLDFVEQIESSPFKIEFKVLEDGSILPGLFMIKGKNLASFGSEDLQRVMNPAGDTGTSMNYKCRFKQNARSKEVFKEAFYQGN